jgi:hypothetical protein
LAGREFGKVWGKKLNLLDRRGFAVNVKEVTMLGLVHAL